MEITLPIVLIALACLAAGAGIAILVTRSRPGQESGRVKELETQLASSREQALRHGVQAAEFEREATTLRGQILEIAQRSAAFEERARQGEEMRLVLREREQVIVRLGAEVAQLREKGAELQTRLEEE